MRVSNIMIKIYRIIILPVVLYGCETWSFTIEVERKLMMFENRVLRRMFVPKKSTLTREWENYIMRNLMNRIAQPKFFGDKI